MNSDWVLAILCIGVMIVFLAFFIVLPMFNAYLEYKMQMKNMEIPHEPVQLYEERLQRDNDESDSPITTEQSDEGIRIHDEKLSL